MSTFTTPRLLISQFDPNNLSHCALIVTMMHTPGYVKHYPPGAKRVTEMDEARDALVATKERMQTTGYGRYLVSLKPTPSSPTPTSASETSKEYEDENGIECEVEEEKATRHIGLVSIQLARHATKTSIAPTIPDIGFGFLPAHYGKGYATEASVGLMQNYRQTRGISQFCGLTLNSNEGAKAVFRRLGFVERGERRVRGIMNGESEGVVLSVWTEGVGMREDDLRAVGL